jgi:uroporphyrinogen III methyltransferase / synthase
MSRPGVVYLVGAGPGDPGLLTRRGARALRRSGVVVHDALIDTRLLELAPVAAERIDVGKRCGGRCTPQHEINDLLVRAAARARVVVRLKGGDPFVFGRGGEEALALVEAGVRFEVVPGVTAAVGAAAYAGIPLTHRHATSEVTFVTGHEDPSCENPSVDWERLAKGTGTLVIYMGMRNLPHLVEHLVRGGRPPETPAAAIQWGTWSGQRTVVAPLAELAGAVQRVALGAPAVIVVGEVVALRDRLEWFCVPPGVVRRAACAAARGLP